MASDPAQSSEWEISIPYHAQFEVGGKPVCTEGTVRLRGNGTWYLRITLIDPDATAYARGRLEHGASHRAKASRAILSDDDVRAIRRRYAGGGVLLRELALEYGVCVAAIGHCLAGRTFPHISDPSPITYDKRYSRLRRLTEVQEGPGPGPGPGPGRIAA